MRIAVAAAGEMITRQCPERRFFQLYDVENQKVTRELTVPSLGEGQEALIKALADYRANILICGALSGKAKAELGDAGILVFGGIIGKAETAVNALLAGSLTSDSAGSCSGEGCEGGCSEESCKNCQFKK